MEAKHVKERCNSPECISVVSVALSFDHVTGGEVFFCAVCFGQIEERLKRIRVRRDELVDGGIHELMADRIVSEEVERRTI